MTTVHYVRNGEKGHPYRRRENKPRLLYVIGDVCQQPASPISLSKLSYNNPRLLCINIGDAYCKHMSPLSSPVIGDAGTKMRSPIPGVGRKTSIKLPTMPSVLLGVPIQFFPGHPLHPVTTQAPSHLICLPVPINFLLFSLSVFQAIVLFAGMVMGQILASKTNYEMI